MSDKLKGGLTMLTFIASMALAQAQEVKAVLIDTLKFGNIKFGGTRQVQKDTAKEYSADMIKGALNDQYTVEDTINPLQVEDILRDSIPEELRSLRDQLVAEMKLPGTKIDGKIDSGGFRRDGPYFPLMQRLVWTLAMEKDRNGLVINVPAGNPDSRAGSAKGEYRKGNVESIRQYIIDKGYTNYTQLPKAKTASRRGQTNGGVALAYIGTGKIFDQQVEDGERTPEGVQNAINFTFLHELGHIFGLGHTEGIMQNAQSYTGRKKYIAENNGEHLSPEVNEQLIKFLLEQKVFGLDTLTSINNEIFNQKFQIYPNPTGNGYTTIKAPHNTKIQAIFITDAQGKKLREYTGNKLLYNKETETCLTYLGLMSGVYYITLVTDKGLSTQKVVNQ